MRASPMTSNLLHPSFNLTALAVSASGACVCSGLVSGDMVPLYRTLTALTDARVLVFFEFGICYSNKLIEQAIPQNHLFKKDK
ncbi:hypothetical protein BDQ12DRAFT_683478 [Crucibulum laeve]|uniref:Uncharacterized protein n=1 Tax=Crucibulum laeve TaxID=68775 RepID=A0A5C3MAZ9_9AGAR|nr:hypothetical protein BDQ12DRAFT_683478 [Crucibulum laeve]